MRVLLTRPAEEDMTFGLAALVDLFEHEDVDVGALLAEENAFAVLEALRRLAERRPVVIAVDDLQWLEDDDTETGAAPIREALEHVGDDRVLRARCLDQLGWMLALFQGRLDAGLECTREAHALSEPGDEPLFRLHVMAARGYLEALGGAPRPDLVDEAMAIEAEHGKRTHWTGPRTFQAEQLFWGGRSPGRAGGLRRGARGDRALRHDGPPALQPVRPPAGGVRGGRAGRGRRAPAGGARGGSRRRGRLRRAAAAVSGRRSEGVLTTAERRIAELVAEGMRDREIASTLFMSVGTVEAHLTRIYRKLDIRSRSELARLAKTSRAAVSSTGSWSTA